MIQCVHSVYQIPDEPLISWLSNIHKWILEMLVTFATLTVHALPPKQHAVLNINKEVIRQHLFVYSVIVQVRVVFRKIVVGD